MKYIFKNIVFIYLLCLIVNAKLLAKENYQWLIPANYESFYQPSKDLIIAYTNNDYENRTGDIFTSGSSNLEGLTKITTYDNGLISFYDQFNNLYFINAEKRVFKISIDLSSLNAKADGFISFKDEDGSNNYLDLMLKKIKAPSNFNNDKYTLVKYLGYGNWQIKYKETSDSNLDIENVTNIGFFSKSGKIIEPIDGQTINPYVNGIALFKSADGTFGFLDTLGNFLIEPILNEVDYSQDLEPGISVYIKDSKRGYIFKYGQTVTEAIYDNHLPLRHNDYFFIMKNNKYGALDLSGKEVIPFVYDEFLKAAQSLSGIFVAKKGYKYGYNDKNGKSLIKPQFAYAFPFNKKFAIVKNTKNKFGIIDLKGKVVIPFDFDNITYFNFFNQFVAKQNNKHGVLQINLENE